MMLRRQIPRATRIISRRSAPQGRIQQFSLTSRRWAEEAPATAEKADPRDQQIADLKVCHLSAEWS